MQRKKARKSIKCVGKHAQSKRLLKRRKMYREAKRMRLLKALTDQKVVEE